jgi:hypothetical protein
MKNMKSAAAYQLAANNIINERNVAVGSKAMQHQWRRNQCRRNGGSNGNQAHHRRIQRNVSQRSSNVNQWHRRRNGGVAIIEIRQWHQYPQWHINKRENNGENGI